MTSTKTASARIISFVLAIFLSLSLVPTAYAESETPATPEVEGKAAIIMDGSSGKVLWGKNEKDKAYPASTTKIMTLLLAVEYGRLDDQIEIPQQAANIPGDSSLVPVQIGERMTFRDLLYGFFMRSGNDAGNAIAVIISGSVDGFCAKMNERAKALGCVNTNFVNPHGYHDENHYTTAYDMALIMREALKNADFREIVSAPSYTMAKTNKREAYPITSGNQMIIPTSDYYLKTMTGGKTGYHSKAGHCFVGSARQGGKELITVDFNSSKAGKWTDTQKMLKYGFSMYQQYSFNEFYTLSPIYVTVGNPNESDSEGGVLLLTPVPGETDDYAALSLAEDLHETVQDFASRMSVEYTRSLDAPIVQGDIIGTLTFTPENSAPLRTTLIASRNVEAAPAPFEITEYIPALKSVNMDMVRFILAIVGLLILLMIFINIKNAIYSVQQQKAIKKRRKKAMQRYRG